MSEVLQPKAAMLGPAPSQACCPYCAQTSRELRAILPETFVLRMDARCRQVRSCSWRSRSRSNQLCPDLTRLRCRQLVAGVAQWLNAHWRAAKVISLGFQEHPADEDWAILPAPSASAGSLCVLRVTCTCVHKRRTLMRMEEEDSDEIDLPQGLRRWVAGVLPLCQNLVTLHLRCVQLMEVPALPLLVHLILDMCEFQPALVASIRGLPMLETLHVDGWWGSEVSRFDVSACTRLRTVYMEIGVAARLVAAGRDLCLPPACTVALGFPLWGESQWWLARLGWRVINLRLLCLRDYVATSHDIFIFAPKLSRLQHLTLVVDSGVSGSLCLARLLGVLPYSVQSLHLDYAKLSSEQAVVVVPATLRALRVKGVCDRHECRRGCCCAPSQCTQDLTFGLHAGLERLQLVLWGARVGLQRLHAGAPAGLRDLNVQARVVDMDAALTAEVGQRGRVLERCDVLDSE